ncbi:uncharacterized protein F5Z01DRAFT_676678 [Emericellopsis atlantica]|uniref:Uncharacterized protein n=1 Tax=Emericellopsis atlantica TaxID=2614577 RepID=A0A9P7ZGQ3_9HYPO|nr:uncharacterized protein F5Z01DRAFT_676678 [Emericellopsis atlantica]KAG9251794.1 hypothetical protein F5Z01DRAFT_676678 [Emericellopsis atlantica]
MAGAYDLTEAIPSVEVTDDEGPVVIPGPHAPGYRTSRGAESIIMPPPQTPLRRAASTAPPDHPRKRRKQGFGALERRAFFNTMVESAPDDQTISRILTSPDDLERAELKHCFEILHACGSATNKDATLATTNESIEGYLRAIFKNWDSGAPVSDEFEASPGDVEELRDIKVQVSAGMLCSNQPQHKSAKACYESDTCTCELLAQAQLDMKDNSLRLNYITIDPRAPPPTVRKYMPCRLGVTATTPPKLLWKTTPPWRAELMETIEEGVTREVHRVNKLYAVWLGRKVVAAWAQGQEYKCGVGGRWGYMGTADIKAMIKALHVG